MKSGEKRRIRVLMAIKEEGEEMLRLFFREHGNTPTKLELLFFLVKHPKAKFTVKVIAGALGMKPLYIKEEVKALVSQGVIEEAENNNGVTFYCLYENTEVGKCLGQLYSMNWRELAYLRRITNGVTV